jgi:hypothetical protein
MRPIDVDVLRFAESMDAQGISVQSAISRNKTGKRTRYTIYYLPWMRHFRTEYQDPNREKPLISYIHESRVKSWDPTEEIEAEKAEVEKTKPAIPQNNVPARRPQRRPKAKPATPPAE